MPTDPAAAKDPTAGVIQVGDVVALGLTDNTCPVGRVSAVDGRGIRLDLYSFLVRYFTAGPRVVLWPEIVTIRHAQEIHDGGATGVPVFQMDAVGDFQTIWKQRGEQPAERTPPPCPEHQIPLLEVSVGLWECRAAGCKYVFAGTL